MHKEDIMRRSLALVVVAALVSLVAFAGAALCSEAKGAGVFVGVVSKIEITGGSAKVLLRDNDTNEDVTVLVKDDLTLEKFKDHRIVPGDEIRVKFELQGGQKLSTYFRKTAGC